MLERKLTVNVLLTCAGRRNYLIQYFKDALEGEGRVFAVDADPKSPALQEADQALIVPKVDDPNYLEMIFKLCCENKIDLVISLNDLELPFLARAKNGFLKEGIHLVVPSPEVVDICFDKWKTVSFIETCGLDAPWSCLTLEDAFKGLGKNELRFPVVIKPRWGSASINIERANDEIELRLTYELIRSRLKYGLLSKISATDNERSVLIQEYLNGIEYGLDVVNDLEGKYVTTIVKRKLAMRAGETDKAVTEENSLLQEVGEKLGRKLGHVGNLDCDVFVTKKGVYVLEMNPRFGGGYPFSHVAGANLPACLIAWAQGREENPEWLTVKSGVASAKCDRLVICKDGVVQTEYIKL